MYCGTCLRDNSLAAELMKQGHDVTLVPLYTPTLTDETNVSNDKIFFGGISVYLEQNWALFRKTPWLLDRHLTIRAGLLEGKGGGGADFEWEDWGLFSWPARFTFEGRDAYNSVFRENIDEQIAGPMMRVYARIPLWIRRDNWFETLLSIVKVDVGINRLTKNQELMAGISLDWPDEDIRTLVGFIGTAR